jgi:hypothetical protein
VSGDRGRYTAGVYILSATGLACAALIVAGELLGSPDRRILWNIGGAALGTILVVYGLILLLLRKLGLVGPRRAEH